MPRNNRRNPFLNASSIIIASLILVLIGALQEAPAQLPSPPVHFANPVMYSSGGDWVYSLAVGDLNGDGHPDVVVANLCGVYNCYLYFWEPPAIGKIGVLLGNGDGTFQPTIVYNSGGYDSYSVAIGDVNGDGHPDLVVANLCDTGDCNSGSVSVLLGNGDGTFQLPLNYSVGGHAWAVAIGDLNADRKPDLVVGTCSLNSIGNCNVGSVDVLPGNGDGTFQTAATYSSGGSYVGSVAIGDLNGDGYPDLVVANGGVGVLLNNGNGTFRAPVTYDSGGTNSLAVAIADVNHDRKLDLLVANCGGSNVACGERTVGVLLGRGNGTFQATMRYKSIGDFIAIADLNGDGHPDVALTGGVLAGNGDGTFQTPVTFNSGGCCPDSIAIADVNGDGKPDVIVGDWGSFSVGVLLNNLLAKTTLTVTSSLSPAFITQPVTFTANIASNPAVSDGKIVTFYNGSTTIGTGQVKGGVASLTTSSLPFGNLYINARYAGDIYHKPGFGFVGQIVHRYPTSVVFTSSLNPSIYGQKITFTTSVVGTHGVTPTGWVTFNWGGTYNIGAAKLDSTGNGTLFISRLNADNFPITAVYQGDATNARSTSDVLNQVVRETTSAAAITSSQNPSTSGEAVTFTATITSPTVLPSGPVTFTAGTTVLGTAQLSNGKAKFTTSSLSIGTTMVTATYLGNSNIAKSSASVTQVINP